MYRTTPPTFILMVVTYTLHTVEIVVLQLRRSMTVFHRQGSSYKAL